MSDSRSPVTESNSLGLRPHLRYASYVARHKWFVFRAGLKTGAPLWRLLIHDWSKLTPAEWTPSAMPTWFEVSVVMKVQAADESDAINRVAGAIRSGYKAAEGIYPVGNFDARPTSSPLRTAQRID